MMGAMALDQDWWPIYDTHGKVVALMIAARYNSFIRHLYYHSANNGPYRNIAMVCEGEFRIRDDYDINSTVPVAYLRWRKFEFRVPDRAETQRNYMLMIVQDCPEFYKEPGVVDMREQWV